MSVECFKWAKSVTGLTSAEKFVLICLADFFNEEKGYAYPSQKTIAEYTCLNRSTISRACKSLKNKRLISWQHKFKDSGRCSSNKYVIHQGAECNISMLHGATETLK